MSSVVDQLPHQPGDPEGSRARSESDAESGVEAQVEPTGFNDEFATEVRAIFTVSSGKGLFGSTVVGDAPQADPVTPAEPVAEVEASAEAVENADADVPVLFANPVVAPKKKSDASPSVGLFLPREEAPVDRPVPALTGLALSPKSEEPAAVPNLFVSSTVAPAEVAFVPAEEEERRRYLWLLILLGLLLIGGAIWLTVLAQSNDTVDAPVTTVATVPSTLVSTTEAPATTASTTAPTTAAPATTEATVETTVTTAAPTVQTTAQRPATTTRRPATTARPATAPPTTAPPTTAATVPDVTFAPPTWSPPTSAAPVTEPPAEAAEPPAEPATEG